MNAQGVLCAGIDFLPPGAPFSTGGIYALDGAQHREVIRVDDPLPGSGRDFRGQAGSTPAVINASGAVVFSASIESETHSPGVYVSRGGVLTKLALNGEAAPGVPGATFTDFDHIEMNDASQIAFLG